MIPLLEGKPFITEFGIVGYSSVILVQEGEMYLLYDCGPKGCALQLKDALKTQGLQPEESAEVTKVEAMNRILAREAAAEGGDEFNQEYNVGIYVGYRYFDTFGVKVRFPFGFGLSYTSVLRMIRKNTVLESK